MVEEMEKFKDALYASFPLPEKYLGIVPDYNIACIKNDRLKKACKKLLANYDSG